MSQRYDPATMPAKAQPRGIAAQLRAAIARAERRGLTRYRIAKLAGTSQIQVGRVADGRTVPRLDTAEKIARAIGHEIVLADVDR